MPETTGGAGLTLPPIGYQTEEKVRWLQDRGHTVCGVILRAPGGMRVYVDTGAVLSAPRITEWGGR